MTKYQLVTNNARKAEMFDARPIAEFGKRGFEYTGGEGGGQLRKELHGQPKFTGLCGPMWGGTADNGEPIIRYEDWDTYNILSR
jgi:hypothetical protein